jgi:hypothetical protein
LKEILNGNIKLREIILIWPFAEVFYLNIPAFPCVSNVDGNPLNGNAAKQKTSRVHGIYFSHMPPDFLFFKPNRLNFSCHFLSS